MFRYLPLFFLFIVNLVSSQFTETLPTDYWAYKVIEQLKLRGFFKGLPQGFKPYTRYDIARMIIEEKDKATSWFERSLFKKLEDEFSEEIEFISGRREFNDDFSMRIGVMLSEYIWREENQRTFRFRGRGKLAFYYGDKFVLYNNSLADQNLLDDTTYTGDRFRGFFSGYTEQGYLKLNLGAVSIKLGRDYIKWGYGRGGNLLISDYAIPYDAVQIFLNTKHLKYNWFFSQLDVLFNANRFLTGGRFELNLWNKLFIGVAQTTLYGGEDKGIDLTIMNPIAFYYEFQVNENKPMNPFIGFDMSAYPFKNFNFYWEFIIDDWQVSRREKSGLEPNEYGFILGIRYADFLKRFKIYGTEFQIEYTQVRNRTYNTKTNYEKYLRFKRPIAHPLGNDFHSLELWISQWFFPFGVERNNFQLTFIYKFIEHGEGRIEKPFDEPWMAPEITPETGYREKFPFGIVETTHQFGFKIFYYYNSNLNINLDLKFSTYRNYKNIDGKRKSKFVFRLWVFFNIDKLVYY